MDGIEGNAGEVFPEEDDLPCWPVGDLALLPREVCEPLRFDLQVLSEVTEFALELDFLENIPMIYSGKSIGD